MTDTVQALEKLLGLEPIEVNLFRGNSEDLGLPQLFGGQVLGQCLSAASKTVEPDRLVHSFHGYFLRPGDASMPVLYQVDRVRDGRSFTTRRILAIQKGEVIFSGSASFHIDEPGFTHQIPMPDVPPPESLPCEWQLLNQLKSTAPDPTSSQYVPFEARSARPLSPDDTSATEPVRNMWFRATRPLPDDQALHRYMLAYVSDYNFVITALQPHGVSPWSRHMQLASLDHSLWFHRPVRVDEWLLYSVESPWAGGARALVRGSIFNQAGELVASVAQEGLIRYRKDRT